MLDRNGRIAVVIAAIVVAVAAFVLLGSGDDETESPTTTAATPAATTPGPTTDAPSEPTEAPTEEPAAEGIAIEVRDGEPVGGVQEIRASQGETVEFSVASDRDDEIHVHGYDVRKDVTAGAPARFSFEADITGIFEIELENARLLVGNLRVEP